MQAVIRQPPPSMRSKTLCYLHHYYRRFCLSRVYQDWQILAPVHTHLLPLSPGEKLGFVTIITRSSSTCSKNWKQSSTGASYVPFTSSVRLLSSCGMIETALLLWAPSGEKYTQIADSLVWYTFRSHKSYSYYEIQELLTCFYRLVMPKLWQIVLSTPVFGAYHRESSYHLP